MPKAACNGCFTSSFCLTISSIVAWVARVLAYWIEVNRSLVKTILAYSSPTITISIAS